MLSNSYRVESVRLWTPPLDEGCDHPPIMPDLPQPENPSKTSGRDGSHYRLMRPVILTVFQYSPKLALTLKSSGAWHN